MLMASLWQGQKAAVAAAPDCPCPCAVQMVSATRGGVLMQPQQLAMPGTQPAFKSVVNSSQMGNGSGKLGPVTSGPGAMSSGTRCHFCKEVITGDQFIRTDLMVCHIECFRCSVCCAIMLGMRAFRLGNRICCQPCFRILTVCAYCGSPVMNGKSWVEFENRAYHPNHMFCSEPGCGVVLCFETGFALSSSRRPVCPAHHPNAVACAVCGCPVTGEGVQLSDRTQLTLRHPECFMCALCGFLLSWEYVIDQYGRPLCCEHIDIPASFLRIACPNPSDCGQKAAPSTPAETTVVPQRETEKLEEETSLYRPSRNLDYPGPRSQIQRELASERLDRASRRHSNRRMSQVQKDVLMEKRNRNSRRSSRRLSRRSSLRRRSALSRRRSDLPERTSYQYVQALSAKRKSALPERKSTLTNPTGVPSDRKFIPNQSAKALKTHRTKAGKPQQNSKTALPFQKNLKKAFPAEHSSRKLDIKIPAGPNKLENKMRPDLNKKPPGFVWLHKASNKGGSNPKPQRKQPGTPKSKNNPTGKEYPAASQSNQSDGSESVSDDSESMDEPFESTTDFTESIRDASELTEDAFESTGGASESTGGASESAGGFSESTDEDNSESTEDASESMVDTSKSMSNASDDAKSMRDASESIANPPEITDAPESSGDASVCASKTAPLLSKFNEAIEYCRAGSDDLEDVEVGCALRHHSKGKLCGANLNNVSKVGQGDSSIFINQPATLNISYASFFETSSESQTTTGS